MTRRRWGSWTLATALAWGGCGQSAGGPGLAELQVTVSDQGGRTTNAHCTVLPVLLGGRVRAEIDVAGEFSMLLEGNHDLVLVSFEGVRDEAQLELAIDAATLREAYEQEVAVTTHRDRHFIVTLSSRCSP